MAFPLVYPGLAGVAALTGQVHPPGPGRHRGRPTPLHAGGRGVNDPQAPRAGASNRATAGSARLRQPFLSRIRSRCEPTARTLCDLRDRGYWLREMLSTTPSERGLGEVRQHSGGGEKAAVDLEHDGPMGPLPEVPAPPAAMLG
jgi:hypothetical protein